MIVAMKKYSFLVYHKEYEQFLKDLQELGVLHVIEKELDTIENESLREKYILIGNLIKAIKFLEKRQIEIKEETKETDGIKILSELHTLISENETYQQKKAAIEKELSSVQPWGNFSWNNIDKLALSGIYTRFFITPQRKFEEEIKDKFFVEEINNLNGNVYFVLMLLKSESVEIDAEEISLPKRSLKELSKQIEDINAINEKTEAIFDDFAAKYIPLLEKAKTEITSILSFDKVKLNTLQEADNKLMVLEGWVPVDKENDLNNFLSKSGIYYEFASPNIEELPPIKLKNNKFSRLYEAIGELYTFPNYGEIDLTPFFAPFYMLFFGFCLGDAGYGLLITLGTIYGLFKVQDKFKPLLKLGMYLGIATTFMGILSGSFFGIFIAKVDWLWIQKYQAFMLGDKSLMALALILGYIQVLFGMFIKAANKARMYGFKYCISQLGWNLIVMISIPFYGLASQGIIDESIGNKIALISLIAGGIPAFFYNSPGKNPFLNIGVGLWDTYQTASGLLGDVLSYIRLFALGISSAILGNVFNTLAVDLSPDTIILRQLVMVLILAFGHSLNFFMAALGSFVHPLRLTFVEFYKNAGFMGGGKKYEPFRN
jgi:V/A-type H+/Na+-transporting ATPase subunit I